MAIDEHLLATAGAGTLMRRYFWEPPALSLGASQAAPRRLEDASNPPDVPFDIVRRPSGGRAVLHGNLWEWSFAVVVPGTRGVDAAYGMVSAAAEAAFRHAGIPLSGRQDVPYRRSALCFATSLRHDLHCAGGKVVAIAQTQRQGAVLVHGSVLERRPPADLLACLEDLVEEPWCGDGHLAHGGVSRDDLWDHFTESMVRIVEHDPGHDREA